MKDSAAAELWVSLDAEGKSVTGGVFATVMSAHCLSQNRIGKHAVCQKQADSAA